MLYVTFRRRSFAEALTLPPVKWSVAGYSWKAIGGPDTARLEATGDEAALWALVDLLRCPVEIANERYMPCWWGFVAEVEVRINALTARVNLDTLANRIAVAYLNMEVTGNYLRATTEWAQDNESVAEYGTFERLDSGDIAEVSVAEGLRNALLKEYSLPAVELEIAPGRDELGATLYCRGWWHTLKRRYYGHDDGADVETTQQIANIVAAVGEFLVGTDVVNASGLYRSPYHDDDTIAQADICDLLAAGVQGGRRLLATVTRERYLRVHEGPAPTAPRHQLRSDGTLRGPQGVLLEPGVLPVGVWAELADVGLTGADAEMLANIARLFLEGAEWDEGQQRITRLEPRGRSAYNVAEVIPG